MANTLNIFSGTTGLNTKTDPVRLQYDPESGVQDLAVAYGVEIDDTGRLSRQKGYTQQIIGQFHSIFCDGGACLFVYGDALCQLNPDFTTYTRLRNVTEGARLSCVQVNDRIYYTNGYEKGYVLDGVSNAWVKGDYVGPTTTRNLTDPPIGNMVSYYNGRIYVIQGDTAFASEQFAYGAFDLVRGYIQFDDEIRMFRPVSDGIYVSTGKQVFFLNGDSLLDYRKVLISNYPAMKRTDVKATGRLVVTQDGRVFVNTADPGVAVIWMADDGIYFGGSGGQYYVLTKDKIVMPAGVSGSGLFYDGKYIGLIDP